VAYCSTRRLALEKKKPKANKKKPRANAGAFDFIRIDSALFDLAVQQGTHRQQRSRHALIHPGPQPQPPVQPRHAACVTMGVAFFSALPGQMAPRFTFCALACEAMAPRISAAAVKVIMSFLKRPSVLLGVIDDIE
jgi:hypothetical protein